MLFALICDFVIACRQELAFSVDGVHHKPKKLHYIHQRPNGS